MQDKKKKIIELWEKTKLVHPSAAEIASEVGVNRSYVWRVIQDYQNEKKWSLRSK